jgi:hypothetical protein
VRCYRDAEERAQVLIAVLAKLLRRGRDEIRQDDLFRTRLSQQHASRVRHEHCHSCKSYRYERHGGAASHSGEPQSLQLCEAFWNALKLQA